jgi:hypothetical protein
MHTNVRGCGTYFPIRTVILDMSDGNLYERLGGRDGIRAVVDEFYDELLADEQLGPLFRGADMEKLIVFIVTGYRWVAKTVRRSTGNDLQ